MLVEVLAKHPKAYVGVGNSNADGLTQNGAGKTDWVVAWVTLKPNSKHCLIHPHDEELLKAQLKVWLDQGSIQKSTPIRVGEFSSLL